MEHKWYILNVMAGQEQKIAESINSLVGKSLKEDVSESLVPCKKIIKIKKGQKVQEDQKLFPGYVFVKANLNSDAFNIINAIPKAMSFLGGKNKPEPVSPAKMADILSLISADNVVTSKIAIFEVGEILNIIEGPFESFSGSVENFDAEKQRVKISVLIFGRATSVDLDINQVEKVS
ncbi:MAG: transcriptional antiterminator NusG [Rickettsiales bacterium]|jgi:transcriptional antiterminator NusG